MTAEEFWNWFEEHNQKYYTLYDESPENKDFLIELFLEKLQEFSDGLYFKIGGYPGEMQDLIITAEGNLDYFEKVQELVDAAPKMDQWNIIAFKPALEGDYIVEYEGLEIDSSELWFLPMQHHENHKLFGLIVAIPDFEPDDRDRYLGAVYQMLDTLIGERATTEDVHYLDLTNLPENPEQEGYIRLSELKRYMEWHKDGLVPFQFSLN